MSQLIVRRSADKVGRLRRIKIRVDGVVVAQLRPKAEESIRLPDGNYQVSAHIDWLSSKTIDVDLYSDVVVRIEVGSPWRKKMFSTEPGTLNIRVLDN